MVSAPLPVRSRYATSWGPITEKQPGSPLGETLTRPSAALGAVATKKSGWAARKPDSSLSISGRTVEHPRAGPASLV